MTLIRHPADGRVHFSELKAMARSPKHYRQACTSARTMTRPMTVGALGDCLVFGNRGYAIYPGKVRNGKVWDEFQAEHAHEIICIASEYEDAVGAADSVLADPQARELLSGCEYQRVLQWEAYGLEFAAGVAGQRGGIDALHIGDRREIDLKITSSVEPDELSRHAWRMLWHAQRACYADGIEAVLGWQPREQWIIAVEASEPHDVVCMQVPEEVLDRGRKSVAMWAEKLRVCDASGVFPGHAQYPVRMTVPSWEEEES